MAVWICLLNYFFTDQIKSSRVGIMRGWVLWDTIKDPFEINNTSLSYVKSNI